MPDSHHTADQIRNLRIEKIGFRKSHAFIIGVNQYPEVKKPLLSAVPDAWQLAHLLWDKQGFDHVWLYINPFAEELENLFAGLKGEADVHFPPVNPGEIQNREEAKAVQEQIFHPDNFRNTPNQRLIYHFHHGLPFDGIQAGEVDGVGDSLVFYYAGHGQAGQFDQGPSGYLLPSDVSDSASMDNRITMERLQASLDKAGCKHTLLILDCCFAGKFRHMISATRPLERSERRPITSEAFERFKRKKAWQVLVSAGSDQTAADWVENRGEDLKSVSKNEEDELLLPHSPFAKALFNALQGEADYSHMGKDTGDGVLTASELKLYLYDQVERITNNDPTVAIQNPDLFPMKNHDGGEFVFINPKNPAFEFAKWQHLNPYKGLLAFEAEDWPFFFGRETAIADVQHKLQSTPVILISSTSALGKSSLVKAGVFPN